MSPDELRKLPGGDGKIPENGTWGGSPMYYYPPGFVHPAVGNPNYVIKNHGAYLFPLTIALVALTSLVVIVRVLSRIKFHIVGVDDWFIIAATVCNPPFTINVSLHTEFLGLTEYFWRAQLSTIAVAVTVFLAVLKGGIGRHWYDITFAEREYGSDHVRSPYRARIHHPPKS